MCAAIVDAQTAVNEAETLFKSGRYTEAAALYETMLVKNPKDALSNYRVAQCYYSLQKSKKAIAHFELAKIKYPKSNYYLGILYQNSYLFDEAEVAFSDFLLQMGSQPFDSLVVDATTRREQSKMAAEMLKRIEDISLIDSTVVNKDDFLAAYNFAADLGSLSIHRSDVGGAPFDFVQYTTQRGDRRLFSDTINAQSDIFSSHKLLNDWSLSESVSTEINSSANENYPFLMSDGVTFYFAADGSRSIGGYDIFMTRFNPEKNIFYTPENIGMPFNSPFNDYMMVIDDVRGIGWFASDRFQQAGKVVIYKFLANKTKQIIRTENADSLRSLAQLKFFQKTEVEENLLHDISNDNNVQSSDFKFVVDENTVYYSPDEFKNEAAASLAIQLATAQIDLKGMHKELELLRSEYAKSSNENKVSIAPLILQIEQSVQHTASDIEKMTVQIRNLEIRELQ
jgi:tetratricopeptide (TPR) repeat protein